MHLLAYLFMCLVFGTTFMAIKIGLNEGVPPLWMAALRFLIASLAILAYLSIRGAAFPNSLKTYANIAFLGLLMTTIPFAALKQ
ncbi:EamA family transporter [Paenibacillus thermotolerans]|uniref:EamA family transporter n=1 Tax=Paenibacillus thermotolerans TaxID=3027807 RepID=UPI00236833CE|nr:MULTISPECIES: EamA family transporter [unclassified Paenibacillus]